MEDRHRADELDRAERDVQRVLTPDQAAGLRARAGIDNWDASTMRRAAFRLAADHARANPISGAHAAQTYDNPHFLRESMAEALACRAGAGTPSPAARDFMGLRISDMASHLLAARGERFLPGGGAAVMARAMHTAGDFPALLQSAGNRVLLSAFQPAASGLRALFRMREAADFRTLSTIRAAGVDRLEVVAESGEVTLGTAFEAVQTYRVRTFARAFSISREALVNDDLMAFDAARAIGAAAAATEAAEFVALLTANSGAGPTMADGSALFTTGRNTLAGAGAAIGVATVSDGRAAMRAQRDLNQVVIGTAPRFIVVGPAGETAAEQLVAALAPATVNAVNPFASGRLEVLVEPRLTGNGWYLFADPAIIPTFEMATLASTGGAPQIQTFQEANNLGVTMRVVHDFGVGAVGVTGAWRNPGA